MSCGLEIGAAVLIAAVAGVAVSGVTALFQIARRDEAADAVSSAVGDPLLLSAKRRTGDNPSGGKGIDLLGLVDNEDWVAVETLAIRNEDGVGRGADDVAELT